MADDSINLEYRIKEINTILNEQHDTILLTEIVEFCGRNDLLEHKVSVDTLKEALNFYFEYKNRLKGKWVEDINDALCHKCSNCNEMYLFNVDLEIAQYNFCPNCGAEMEEIAKNATTTEEEENDK